jgi:transposase
MSKALARDLRTRVLAAVHAGASHREAAARFGASAARVSRWRALARQQGDARPGPLGGDRRLGRIAAQAPLILALIAATPDATNDELRVALADRGQRCGYGTWQRRFRRHRITRKKTSRAKRPALPASRIARTSGHAGRPGSTGRPTAIPRGWSFSTRPGRRPT